MNTLHTTTAQNINNNEIARLILTIAGIVTALFCLVVLMKEPHITGGDSIPKLLETSKVVALDFVTDVKAWF